MNDKINCKDQLTNAEKRKQAINLLENWLQNLNDKNKSRYEKKESNEH